MATEQSIMAVIRAARPQFRTGFDKAAFAVHAAFVAAGYALHATGPPAFAYDALSISSKDEVGMDNWNDVEDSYGFVYSNPDKGSKKVLVKCLVMNDKLLVDVLKEGGSEPLHLELDVDDYVQEDGGTNYGSQFKNLGKLVEILNKLDAASASSSSTKSSRIIVPPGSGGSDLFTGPGAGMYPSRYSSMATRLKFVVREQADVVEAPAMSGWKLCKQKSVVDVELHTLTTPADKQYFKELLAKNELVYVRGVDGPPQGYSLCTLTAAVAVSCLISGLFGFSASRGGWELAITLAKLSALGCGLGIARMTLAAAALACSTMIEHMRPRFSTVFQQWQQWWAPVST